MTMVVIVFAMESTVKYWLNTRVPLELSGSVLPPDAVLERVEVAEAGELEGMP